MSSQIATQTSSRKERNGMEVMELDGSSVKPGNTVLHGVKERPDDLRKTYSRRTIQPIDLFGTFRKTISRFRTLINRHWHPMKGQETDPAIIMCWLAGENLFLIQHVSNIASPQSICLLVIFGSAETISEIKATITRALLSILVDAQASDPPQQSPILSTNAVFW
jgi:hypothetical protein